MISEFKIGNFKAFGPAQTIPLRPITLVFGPNSAGKSSIIQSLLLARHIHDTGNADAHQTTLGGAAVDLGGFGRYVHKRESARESIIGLSFSRSEIRESIKLLDFETVAIEFAIQRPLGNEILSSGNVPLVNVVSLYLDGREWGRLIRTETGRFDFHREVALTSAIKDLTPKFRALKPPKTCGGARAQRRREEKISIYHSMFEIRFRDELMGFQLRGLAMDSDWDYSKGTASATFDAAYEDEHNLSLEDDPFKYFKQYLREFGTERDFWRDTGMSDKELAEDAVILSDEGALEAETWAVVRCYHVKKLIELVSQGVQRTLSNLSYLGPLRWIPPRLIPDGEQFDASWKAGGGEAWQRLRSEPELLGRVNRFLKETLHSPYRLECQSLAAELDAETIALCVKRALESSAAASTDDPHTSRVAEDAQPYPYGKAGTPDLAKALEAELRAQNSGGKLAELSLVDAESGLAVSHRDVGTGISQLLPVLVNAAGGKNQLIAIEQPELHLHPALQAELGDVFIESALGENKNTFLIETHSEHLILRLLRRIRETAEGELPPGATPLRPEDVAVLYVKPGSEGSEVIELPVNIEGDFDKPWPDGFFPERSKELF